MRNHRCLLWAVALIACLSTLRADTFRAYFFIVDWPWMEAQGYDMDAVKAETVPVEDGKMMTLYSLPEFYSGPDPDAYTRLAGQALADMGGKGLTLLAYGELEQAEPGLWSLDQSWTLSYATALDESGEPSEFEERQVGFTAEVREDGRGRGQGEIKLSLVTLDKWLPLAAGSPIPVPLFSTRETSSKQNLPEELPLATMPCIGKDEVWFFVLHRVAEE
ncbi:hypothetical protein H5P28_03645 [Ruficoccus amylovorans]|uniref:Uncharacterized protein n=1 Tax=Ruficoccus amylovorans TaxID=1804625 RepID=A0A842HCL5_9BACT|nr:hypothetical protein [Ruficoccus amylovorans]MBC2593347.1 hypothetical protein [Ruficoccus amylovorans]